MAGKTSMLPSIDHGDGAASFALHSRCTTEADLQEEDVQVIPLEATDGLNSRYKGWTQGKKNFTRVALKVLTDIYDKKSRALFSGSDEGETMTSEEPRRAGHVSDATHEEPRRLVKESPERGLSPEHVREQSASPATSPRRILRKRSTSASMVYLHKDSISKVSPHKDSTSRVSPHKDSTSRVSPHKDTTSRVSPHVNKDSTSRVSPHKDSTSRVSPHKDSVSAGEQTEGGMSTEMPKKILRRRTTSHSLSINAEHKKSSVTTKKSAGRQKASLASAIGIVAFRKIYMSKLNALTSETKEENDARKESMKKTQTIVPGADDNWPISPRFTATLSPEAQFAMLKGYEDKLINGLKTAFPDQQNTMVRVKTPPYGRSLCITHVGLHSSSDRSTAGLNASSETDRSERYDRRKKEYHAQRKVTGQVETAVDMLDHLRGSSGHYNTISPRLRVGRKLEPVTTYNAWTHQWAQQFKIARRLSEK